jgi:hypothetical protein
MRNIFFAFAKLLCGFAKQSSRSTEESCGIRKDLGKMFRVLRRSLRIIAKSSCVRCGSRKRSTHGKEAEARPIRLFCTSQAPGASEKNGVRAKQDFFQDFIS